MKPTDVHLLSLIIFEKPEDLSKNFKMKFIDFFINYIIRAVSYEIQYTDFSIAGVIFSVQLWHGEITTPQFLKSISTAAVVIECGFTAAASFFFATCAVLLSIAGGPATILVLLGTAAGGLICGGAAYRVCRYLTERFFPDGEKEELNAQRKLYCQALEVLACSPDSSMRNIQRAYYRKAQVTHSDKCDNKEVAAEEFKKIVTAYEIAKSYHEVLEDACKTLNIPRNFTIGDLKICNKNMVGIDLALPTPSPESGQQFPSEEIYFIKNTEIPLRTTRVVRQVMSCFTSNWAYNCKDESLGLLHDPQTSKLDVNQSASVQIWLTSPLHRVHENDTVILEW
ncbi:unnamed protein product [Rotaria socialis]|uniref:J domain-containing protein n=1 Tax=Rotaria socialis TaxID=392032 RepID=A0A818A0P6_9BILA|nr:unnamed protein product [Rotaria socialis]